MISKKTKYAKEKGKSFLLSRITWGEGKDIAEKSKNAKKETIFLIPEDYDCTIEDDKNMIKIIFSSRK